ncbi:MAG: hypothetical protein IKQ06_01580 [Bacilli bacterium]|nr:hypothetical protein [Bacilli bacterium]
MNDALDTAKDIVAGASDLVGSAVGGVAGAVNQTGKSAVKNGISPFLQSIGDAIGGFGAQLSNKAAVNSNNNLRFQTQVGGFVANVFGDDFAGVSNFEDLKEAISKYSREVQEIVKEYDERARLDTTFKGKAGEELHTFVEATKELLNAYVKLIEKWNEELDDAYARYQAGDVQIQQNVQSDAQAVQQAAQNVSLG